MIQVIRLILGLGVFFWFVGCGGGEGNGDSNNTIKNTPPIAKSINLETIRNVSINGNFNVNDSEDTYFKYYITKEPSSGKLMVNEDSNMFSYTPNSSFIGKDTFTYKAYDGNAYSNEVTVSITVNKAIEAQNDTITPLKAKIISINSSSNSITLFWLPSKDDITSANQLIYEVHCSEDKGFEVDDSTKYYSTIGSLEADIDNLEEDTLYYVKIKTIDSGGNIAISDEMSILTGNADDITFNNSNSFKKADNLFLHNIVENNKTITYIKNEKTIAPNKGDILIGDRNSRTLKRVTDIKESNGKVILSTEQASLNQIVEKATIKSKTILLDIDKIEQSSSSKGTNGINSFKKGYFTFHKWESGRFSIKNEETKKVSNLSTVNKKNHSINLKKLTASKDGLTITAVEKNNDDINNPYIIKENQTLEINIDVKHASNVETTKIKNLVCKIEHDNQEYNEFQFDIDKIDSSAFR